jgi:3-phosphoglycerate kinase
MQYLRSLKAAGLKDKIVLLRLDFNTEDDWRIKAALPTVKFLSKNCKSTVILSHKGRPERFDMSLSLFKKSESLKKLLHKKVNFIDHFNFGKAKKEINAAPKGSIFLFENLRFLKGEAENDLMLAKNLALLGDLYVNDAFAVSHRANASVTAITKFMPSYAGFELETEIKNLSKVMKNPKRPLVIILGGLKIEDKLQVYKNLKNKASAFLIGGALNKKLLKLKLPKIIWPVDFLTEDGTLSGEIRDIGPRSIELFKKEIRRGRAIIWNGPLGDITKKHFENGTKEIARAIAANKKAYKVAGGGETIMFLKKLKLDKKINFLSTGGGAMLEFLAGKKLPGIKALN